MLAKIHNRMLLLTPNLPRQDYATVFSFGDGWEGIGGEDPSSLVYR